MSDSIAKHIKEFKWQWEECYRQRLPVNNVVGLPRRRWHAVEHRWKYGGRRPQEAGLSVPPHLATIEEEDEDEEVSPSVSGGGFNSEIQAERVELNPDNGYSRKWQIRDFDPPPAVGPFPARRVKRLVRHRPTSSGRSTSARPSAPLLHASTFAETPETTRTLHRVEDRHWTYSGNSTLAQASKTRTQALSSASFSTSARDPMTVRRGLVVPPATATPASTVGRSSDACNIDSHDDIRHGLGGVHGSESPHMGRPSLSGEFRESAGDRRSTERRTQRPVWVCAFESCDAPGPH